MGRHYGQLSLDERYTIAQFCKAGQSIGQIAAALDRAPSTISRELVRLLVAEGCHVAMCDVSMRGMAETRRQCEATGLPQGLRVTAHLVDVPNEADVMRFRDGHRLHRISRAGLPRPLPGIFARDLERVA